MVFCFWRSGLAICEWRIQDLQSHDEQYCTANSDRTGVLQNGGRCRDSNFANQLLTSRRSRHPEKIPTVSNQYCSSDAQFDRCPSERCRFRSNTHPGSLAISSYGACVLVESEFRLRNFVKNHDHLAELQNPFDRIRTYAFEFSLDPKSASAFDKVVNPSWTNQIQIRCPHCSRQIAKHGRTAQRIAC